MFGNTASSTTGGSGGSGGDGVGGGDTSTSTSSGNGGAGGGSTSSSGNGGAGGQASTPVEIPCGNQTCKTGEMCCVELGPNGKNSCATEQAGCANNEVAVECNGPSDCPNSEVCCAQVSMNGPPPPDVSDVECKAKCESSGQSMAITLCETAQDCPGGQCNNTMMLPGFKICY